MRKYRNIDEFYDDNPARRTSGEYDFGVWWRSKALGHSHWDTFRITWITATGEVYLWKSVTEEIYLLDKKFPTEADIEKHMLHWADRCGKVDLDTYFPEVIEYAKKQKKN